jgi:hypothetical protein
MYLFKKKCFSMAQMNKPQIHCGQNFFKNSSSMTCVNLLPVVVE